MTKLNFDKKKVLLTVLIIAVAFLLAAIVFKEEFAAFINAVNEKLSVLNSLVIGAIIAYLMNPVEKFFFSCYSKIKKHNFRKFLSIFSAYLLIIGMIVLFVVISLPQITKSVSELPGRFQEFAIVIAEKLTLWYNDFIQSEIYSSIVNVTGEEIDINAILNSLGETYLNLDSLFNSITEYAINLAKNLYSGVSDTFIGLIFSIYVLAAKDRLKAHAKKITSAIVGPKHIDGVLDTVRYTDYAFGGFIQGKLVNAIIIFILMFLAFWIFGIPYPQLLALIVGITDIIPVFGPFIGAIPSAFIVLIAAPEKVIPMLIIILVLQQIDGNYIGPRILGESTGLSAIGVFVAIIVMGGYFGLIGMLIGVPTFVVAQYLITKAVDKRLVERGMSTELDDYYTDPDLAHLGEHGAHSNIFTKIISGILESFKSILKLFKKLPKIRKKSEVNAKKSSEAENTASKED